MKISLLKLSRKKEVIKRLELMELAEMIREKVLLLTREEVPHSVAVEFSREFESPITRNDCGD